MFFSTRTVHENLYHFKSNLFGKFTDWHSPYSHMSGYIPFDYQCLLFCDPEGRGVSCSVNKAEVKGAGLPASKLKYTIQQLKMLSLTSCELDIHHAK